MMEVGGFFTEGFANGISKLTKEAVSASQGLASAATKPVEQVRFSPGAAMTRYQQQAAANTTSGGSGSGDVHVTIGNISLPGVKNGESFVKEINGISLKQAFKAQN